NGGQFLAPLVVLGQCETTHSGPAASVAARRAAAGPDPQRRRCTLRLHGDAAPLDPAARAGRCGYGGAAQPSDPIAAGDGPAAPYRDRAGRDLLVLAPDRRTERAARLCRGPADPQRAHAARRGWWAVPAFQPGLLAGVTHAPDRDRAPSPPVRRLPRQRAG